MIKKHISILMAVMSGLSQPLSAQSLFHRIDSTVASRYYHMRGIDTTYIAANDQMDHLGTDECVGYND